MTYLMSFDFILINYLILKIIKKKNINDRTDFLPKMTAAKKDKSGKGRRIAKHLFSTSNIKNDMNHADFLSNGVEANTWKV